MKIRGEWLVLAERVIVDSLTQNLTLVSCLEQVAALKFPAQHHGFGVAARYRCEGPPPTRAQRVRYRLMRLSEFDPPETISEFGGDWHAGDRRARIGTNFQLLRLKQPEVLSFRMDHRIGNGPWVQGPTCSIDVVTLELTPAQLAAMESEATRLGLVNPGR
jgi:hypothetical protein